MKIRPIKQTLDLTGKICSILGMVLFILLAEFFSPVMAQNFVTTYAGTGTAGFVNGDTSIASFDHPFGICIDPEGNLYLADAYNHCIRKIGANGQVTTYAGSGEAGYLDGPADEAKFNQPINICLNPEGNMFVSDFLNQRIRKITADGMVTTLAGSGVAGYLDGPVAEAQFNYPRGICLDDTGNLYIGDSWNHRIRRIGTDGMVMTWAGGGTSIGVQSVGAYADGSDTSARFYTPCEVTIDQFNNLFIADAYNHRIRKIDPQRMVTTVAGSGGFGPNGGGFANGPGNEARFNTPTACFVALDGHIFVGDGSNQRVRMIDQQQVVTTLAGSGVAGFEDGQDTLASFNFPRGTVMDYALNRLYVVDYNNHAVRIIHFVPVTGTSSLSPNLFSVRPVPCRNKIWISSVHPMVPDATFNLYSLGGRIICRGKITDQPDAVIDLSDQENGIYFLQIRSGGITIQTLKIMKAD